MTSVRGQDGVTGWYEPQRGMTLQGQGGKWLKGIASSSGRAPTSTASLKFRGYWRKYILPWRGQQRKVYAQGTGLS